MKSNLINENYTIKKVMQQLQFSKIKILFILNKSNNLVGTITDGDVRRGILSGYTDKDKAIEIANLKPFTIDYKKKIDDKYIKKIFLQKKINALPILKRKKIFKVYYFEDFLLPNFEKDTDVIIPCGGFGTRLRPITNRVPKCLIKIKNNNTIIDLIINNLIKYNFRSFHFLTHYKSNMIKKHINSKYKNKRISKNFYVEKKPLGTAGGLSLLNRKYLHENLLIINSDILASINMNDLLQSHYNNRSDCTIVTQSIKQTLDFGSIRNFKDNFTSIEEKPVENYFINAGIYVFKKSCLKILKKNRFTDMNEMITNLKKKKYKIKLYHSLESWIDLGTKKNLEFVKQNYNVRQNKFI